MVWSAIALHTTPEVPYGMDPVVAATTAGVETDVLGIRIGAIESGQIDAVTASHPRPNSKAEIKDRPDTTFGTVNADVLEQFVPGFRRTYFVDVIKNSARPD